MAAASSIETLQVFQWAEGQADLEGICEAAQKSLAEGTAVQELSAVIAWLQGQEAGRAPIPTVPTVNDEQTLAEMRGALYAWFSGGRLDKGAIVQLAKRNPALMAQAAVAVAAATTEGEGLPPLVRLQIAAAFLELGVRHSKDAVVEMVDAAASLPASSPGTLATVMMCSAMVPKAGRVVGRQLLQHLEELLADLQQHDMALSEQCQAAVGHWLEEELGMAQTVMKHENLLGSPLQWILLLLARNLDLFGVEAVKALDRTAFESENEHTRRVCQDVLSWVADLVALSGIQQLRGSESFINTNPQEGDVEDYARVGTNLERRIVDFVLHLGSDVGSIAMQAVQHSERPTHAGLFGIVELACWGGVTSVGSDALHTMFESFSGGNSHGILPFMSILCQTLVAGGGAVEMQLWVAKLVQSRWHSGSLTPQQLAAQIEALHNFLLHALSSTSDSVQQMCRLGLQPALQAVWLDVALLLRSRDLDGTNAIKHLLGLLSASVPPSLVAMGHSRPALTSVLGFLLRQLDSIRLGDSLSDAHRQTTLHAMMKSGKDLLIRITSSSVEIFEQACDLLLDLLLSSALCSVSSRCPSKELLAIYPPVVLNSDGAFQSVALVRMNTSSSDISAGDRGGKRIKHMHSPGSLLAQNAELSWTMGPMEYAELEKSHLQQDSVRQEESNVERLEERQSRQRIYYLMDFLNCCVVGVTSYAAIDDPSNAAPGANSGSANDTSKRAEVLGRTLQCCLNDAFGEAPALGAYESALPRNPSAVWHSRVMELLSFCPALLDLVMTICEYGGSAAARECRSLLRALLAGSIAKSAAMTNVVQRRVTAEAMKVLVSLSLCGWTPTYMATVAEIIHALPPEDLVTVLMAVWRNTDEVSASAVVVASREAIEAKTEEWRSLMQCLLHKHCKSLGPYYHQMMVAVQQQPPTRSPRIAQET